MNELIQRFNASGVRYLLMGGQAVRLAGMPRFSMDWDFLIPSKDRANLETLNSPLQDEIDPRRVVPATQSQLHHEEHEEHEDGHNRKRSASDGGRVRLHGILPSCPSCASW